MFWGGGRWRNCKASVGAETGGEADYRHEEWQDKLQLTFFFFSRPVNVGLWYCSHRWTRTKGVWGQETATVHSRFWKGEAAGVLCSVRHGPEAFCLAHWHPGGFPMAHRKYQLVGQSSHLKSPPPLPESTNANSSHCWFMHRVAGSFIVGQGLKRVSRLAHPNPLFNGWVFSF